MLEKPLERLLFACRWLLAPLYLGLALALIVLGIKFFQEAFHVIAQVTSLAEADLVLTGGSEAAITTFASIRRASTNPVSAGV